MTSGWISVPSARQRNTSELPVATELLANIVERKIVRDHAAEQFLLNHFVAFGSNFLNSQRDLQVSNVVFDIVATFIKLGCRFAGNVQRRHQVQPFAVLQFHFVQVNN